jgi:hypothetical protein
MTRLFLMLLVLLPMSVGEVDSQVATCRLAPRPYGFGGLCQLDTPERGVSQSLRLPIRDSARIWIATGPQDPPPWRGNLSLPATEVAFEIAYEGGDRSPDRIVFRTGLGWLLVKEWRHVALAQPPCAACDRGSSGLSLVLDLVNPPPPTEDDMAILHSALAGVEQLRRWNRQEVQACPNAAPAETGLFCLLYDAVEARMERYHHRQPALELVRSIIIERWRDRIVSHTLVDFNNHPATTMVELRSALELALERARAQAPSGRP